jgi:hypothetical protein
MKETGKGQQQKSQHENKERKNGSHSLFWTGNKSYHKIV